MFDVSFSELLVIAVVALLVIGPEKLPKVARTLGALTGRMQRYAAQIREEVNRETRFEELQKLQQEMRQAATEAETGANSILQSVQPSQYLEETAPQAATAPVKPTRRKRKKPSDDAD